MVREKEGRRVAAAHGGWRRHVTREDSRGSGEEGPPASWGGEGRRRAGLGEMSVREIRRRVAFGCRKGR